MRFFNEFPLIEYNNKKLRNIILKSSLLREVFEKTEVYYPFVLRDGDRPDTVAYDYYGDSNYAWVVLYSNDIVDPYYDWPLDDRDLYRHIEKKYDKTVDQTKLAIKHYEYTGIGGNIETAADVERKSWIYNLETWSHLTADERSGWTPVYEFDYEVDLNEAKRGIRLLDKKYLVQISEELSKIYNA